MRNSLEFSLNGLIFIIDCSCLCLHKHAFYHVYTIIVNKNILYNELLSIDAWDLQFKQDNTTFYIPHIMCLFGVLDKIPNVVCACCRQGGHTELADRMTELVYEATDRMIYFLTGEKPDHASGRHYIVPRAHDTHEMTDVAKAARGKLQLVCLTLILTISNE